MFRVYGCPIAFSVCGCSKAVVWSSLYCCSMLILHDIRLSANWYIDLHSCFWPLLRLMHTYYMEQQCDEDYLVPGNARSLRSYLLLCSGITSSPSMLCSAQPHAERRWPPVIYTDLFIHIRCFFWLWRWFLKANSLQNSERWGEHTTIFCSNHCIWVPFLTMSFLQVGLKLYETLNCSQP